MNSAVRSINAIRIPRILYGTAWKEDATEGLTEQAIRLGFRGIDTANQRRHYYEAAVGRAVSRLIAEQFVGRQDLFLQSKFTFRNGQDHRLPYDESASVAEQVQQSLHSSLEHLQTDHLDSFVLHGPMTHGSLTADDWSAWRAMEQLYHTGSVRILGISNVAIHQLRELHQKAEVQPRFVQNRCYASQRWDAEIRQFCSENDIVYQGFSLLTANRDVVASSLVSQLAAKYGKTAAQVVLRFSLELGMVPLTGTTSAQHMADDLSLQEFDLEPNEVMAIETILDPGSQRRSNF